MVEQMQLALKIMQDALLLLDSAGAPPDIGAHLDLAIVRLKESISRKDDSQINA